MKKLANIVEVEGEGFTALMGETITVMCVNYFYTGTLIGVNDTCILLKDPKIVYETGDWSSKDWADAQALPCEEYYIQVSSIESFGVLK